MGIFTHNLFHIHCGFQIITELNLWSYVVKFEQFFRIGTQGYVYIYTVNVPMLGLKAYSLM